MDKNVVQSGEATIVVHPVARNDLQAWLLAEEYIKRAMVHAENWNMDDVLVDYIKGGTQLTLFYYGDRVFGAMISGIERYPRKTLLHIYAVSTDPLDFDWFPETWRQVKNLARNNGCSSVIGSGRQGWLRRVPEAQPLHTAEVKI